MIRFFVAFALTTWFLLSLTDYNASKIVDLIHYPSNVEYFQTSIVDDAGLLKVPYDSCVVLDKDNPYDNCMQKQTWMKINTKTLPST